MYCFSSHYVSILIDVSTCTYVNQALHVNANRIPRKTVSYQFSTDLSKYSFLMIAHNKKCENRLILSHHDQAVLEIWHHLLTEGAQN